MIGKKSLSGSFCFYCHLIHLFRISELPLLTNPRHWLEGHSRRGSASRGAEESGSSLQNPTPPSATTTAPEPEVEPDNSLYEHVFLTSSQLSPTLPQPTPTQPPSQPLPAAVQPQASTLTTTLELIREWD